MRKYYIGFDIGTDSIGWATTDEEYNLLKARGQDFWGTYLFDSAETAQNRRLSRTARRRLARKNQRVKLLQELFAAEIVNKDACFFERLKNSKYTVADKTDNVRYEDNLFHDDGFTDKDFHEKYPTVYHLRKAFLDEESASKIYDVRLLYLAVSHILKNRGHFLFDEQNINVCDQTLAEQSFKNINVILQDMDEDNVTFTLNALPEVMKTLAPDVHIAKTDKEKKLKALLGASGNKTCEMLIKAMIGGKVSTVKLFDLDENSELSIKDFCFDDAGFELEQLRGIFSENEFALVCEAKRIYDWSVLSQILGNHKYISEAMCSKYDSHRADLKQLKDYVKNNLGKDKYKEIFSNKIKAYNYAFYVGNAKEKEAGNRSKEDFYKFLKGYIAQDTDIYNKIEKGVFLEKQRTNANGVIPYQVHLAELKVILDNASQNFPFLLEVQDGYSVKDKIIKLMTFRIPYYVGPLNDAHKKFAWVKKYPGTEREKITPWNFDKIVDKNASEDEFIGRMTNKCKYLIGEDVLPRQSLLYSEFAFLNELNNVTYRGKRLDKPARDVIIAYAKESGKKLTLKNIGKVLEENGLIEKGEGRQENFAGIDKEIKSSFSTYKFFKRVFGENFNENDCEEIVRCFTVMGDNNQAAERIKRTFKFDDEVIKKLKDLNCSGWGSLSKKLLDSEEVSTVIESTGEVLTIIRAMRETGCNFMELLSAKYDFSECIRKFNESYNNDGRVNYETVDNLCCSPSVKRAIWRTVCLAREIEKVQGCHPSRIFIEMARGEDKKKERTTSRKEQVLNLYKSIHDDVRDWYGEIEATEDKRFLSDRLYLYYMQMGRSAYSGKPIKLEEVFNTNICDIDHIYPQSKTSDNSVLNNKVLCYKTENNSKQDEYPVKQEIREKMKPLWACWHSKNLINDEKYARLTRSASLTQDELSGFINRQLVETRQSTKAVAHILEQMYPNSEIIYSKACNVTEFKNTVNNNDRVGNIVKVRELNDLHHAKDAYLNIVVGNVYRTKFSRYYLYKTNKDGLSKNDDEKYNVKKLFYENVYGAWKPEMMKKIVSVVNKNTPKTVRFTSSGHGKLFDATIEHAGKKNNKFIPLKYNDAISDTYKYGGYNNAATAHFVLAESIDKKGEKIISLEAIPIYVTLLDSNAVIEFLKNNAELKSPKVLIDKIKINSLIRLNGANYWLRGKSGKNVALCSANELVIDNAATEYLQKIFSFLRRETKLRKKLVPDEEFDKISAEQNVALYDALYQKLSSAPYVNMPTIKNHCSLFCNERDFFVNMDTKQQLLLLVEMLHFLQCNSDTSDISAIGGPKNAGKLLKSRIINSKEEALLITQSPTGYYKNVVDLTAFYRQ